MLSYLDINVHFYFLGKMSLLHSLYLIANPDLSYYTLENLSSAEETAYKALLARGGTLYLQGENPHATLNPRNQNITEFINQIININIIII